MCVGVRVCATVCVYACGCVCVCSKYSLSLTGEAIAFAIFRYAALWPYRDRVMGVEGK